MEPDCPVRKHMDDPNIQWNHGKPDYTIVNEKYLKERSKTHPVGSLEKIVENLVKTWEMESSHKAREEDWQSIERDTFTISSNGGRRFKLKDNIEIGNYNMLMWDSPLYQAEEETNQSSHQLFRQAMPGGFAWEVLEVFSGPPKVSFTWRHWGKWEGKYKDCEPTGENLELTGSCVAAVNENLQIVSIEVFYDPNPMIAKLMNFKLDKNCPVC
ncbi:pathogen-related protein-like [Pecten maximus]|uniref:pathogen-related protein-like n=1 Tax=Pecten maximus TaxID=6579 RepID=UPI0014583321|nr:pathogen-related protein-like [Pecten maximus]